MAIEPISSAMSYTAQPVAKAAAPQPMPSAEQGQTIEVNAPQVDAQTLSVSKAQTDGEGSGNGGKNGASKQEGQPQQVSDEAIKSAMKELQKKNTNYISEFGIHEQTNRITIKIVDKKTKEVIKELPPEKTLDMIARVWEYAGLVVDEKR